VICPRRLLLCQADDAMCTRTASRSPVASAQVTQEEAGALWEEAGAVLPGPRVSQHSSLKCVIDVAAGNAEEMGELWEEAGAVLSRLCLRQR